MPEIRENYLNGEWVSTETGETINVANTANLSKIIAQHRRSSVDDTTEAVDAAKSE